MVSQRGGFKRPIQLSPWLGSTLSTGEEYYGQELHGMYKEAYRDAYERYYVENKVPWRQRRTRRPMTLHVFYKYLYMLRRLGWIEDTREEPTEWQNPDPEFTAPRRYFKITSEGLAKLPWQDISLAYESK